VAVYGISAVSLLVVYFLVNRQTIIPKRTARRGDQDERPMKTKKEQRKEEKKQTSKPQDLVPKKDAKGGWGVGGTTPIRVPPPAPLGWTLGRPGKFLGPRISLQNACQKENERISTTLFLLWHFSPGEKIQNCSAQFLSVCRIVHVQFKVHRIRDGFSVATPCCSANRSQRSSAITSIRLERERFSKDAICSSLFSLLLTHRQVELCFVVVLFGFCHSQLFYTSFFDRRSRRLKAMNCIR
jgi:hypothetical protein